MFFQLQRWKRHRFQTLGMTIVLALEAVAPAGLPHLAEQVFGPGQHVQWLVPSTLPTGSSQFLHIDAFGGDDAGALTSPRLGLPQAVCLMAVLRGQRSHPG